MKRMSRRDEKGAATVEFAFVAFLLLLIVFGIIEFGIILFDKHVLTNATREGSRAGVVMRIPRLPDADIRQIITDYAEAHMVSSDSSSNLVFSQDNLGNPTWISPKQIDRVGETFGTELIINVSYQYDFFMLSMVGLGPITLEAETRMRME